MSNPNRSVFANKWLKVLFICVLFLIVLVVIVTCTILFRSVPSVDREAIRKIDEICEGDLPLEVFVPIFESLGTRVIQDLSRIRELRSIIQCHSCERLDRQATTTSGGTSIEIRKDTLYVRILASGMAIIGSHSDSESPMYLCRLYDRKAIFRIARTTNIDWPPKFEREQGARDQHERVLW